MLTDTGWYYFCSDCNDYHPKNWFYTDDKKPFGVFPTCHKNKSSKQPADKNMAHLKMRPVTDDDISGTLEFLESLGYDTDKPVYLQFLERHGLKP